MLYNPYVVMLLHGSVWIPQIRLTYVMNRRLQPPVTLWLGLTICQIFPTLYMFGCPKSLYEIEPNEVLVCYLVIVQACCMIMMYLQFKKGPRFFVPPDWRRNPNAYNYYFKFSRSERRDG